MICFSNCKAAGYQRADTATVVTHGTWGRDCMSAARVWPKPALLLVKERAIVLKCVPISTQDHTTSAHSASTLRIPRERTVAARIDTMFVG